MIIKGKSRARPGALAAHLGNAEKNERVTLLETRGTVANDLRGALVEMDAYAAGTKCERSLYHAAISPEPPHRMSAEQRLEAVNALEEKLGLTGHSRVIVMHEKLGREHVHVVWSRIDLSQMKAVPDSHNYRKHEEVARDLERRFGHDRVQGAHHEREGVARPDRTPSRAELRQEERTEILGKQVKVEVSEAMRMSDGPEAFKSALENRGFQLARGDRRDFVVVDRAGGIHSLARRLDGMKAAELRAFMEPLDISRLPSAAEAQSIARDRREDRYDAGIEKKYRSGADYVTQSQAALREHKIRQPRLDRANGINAWDRLEQSERKRRDLENHRSPDEPRRIQKPSVAVRDDLSPEMQERLDRLLGGSEHGLGHEPGRQPSAPGGGRSRSR